MARLHRCNRTKTSFYFNLGHSSTTTTEVYARASEKKKQEALAKLNPGIIKDTKSSWKKDRALMSYLRELQQKY